VAAALPPHAPHGTRHLALHSAHAQGTSALAGTTVCACFCHTVCACFCLALHTAHVQGISALAGTAVCACVFCTPVCACFCLALHTAHVQGTSALAGTAVCACFCCYTVCACFGLVLLTAHVQGTSALAGTPVCACFCCYTVVHVSVLFSTLHTYKGRARLRARLFLFMHNCCISVFHCMAACYVNACCIADDCTAYSCCIFAYSCMIALFMHDAYQCVGAWLSVLFTHVAYQRICRLLASRVLSDSVLITRQFTYIFWPTYGFTWVYCTFPHLFVLARTLLYL
jgi:hypothetical protein